MPPWARTSRLRNPAIAFRSSREVTRDHAVRAEHPEDVPVLVGSGQPEGSDEMLPHVETDLRQSREAVADVRGESSPPDHARSGLDRPVPD